MRKRVIHREKVLYLTLNMWFPTQNRVIQRKNVLSNTKVLSTSSVQRKNMLSNANCKNVLPTAKKFYKTTKRVTRRKNVSFKFNAKH